MTIQDERTARCTAADVKMRNVITACTQVKPRFDDSSTVVGFRLFHLPHFRLVLLRVPHVINIILSLRNFKGILPSSKATYYYYYYYWGTAVAQWLRCCATNRKVAGSIPDGVIGISHWHIILSDRTMALGSTHPLTEISTRSISWG